MQDDDDMFIIVGASAQELPDVKALFERAGNRCCVCAVCVECVFCVCAALCVFCMCSVCVLCEFCVCAFFVLCILRVSTLDSSL